MFCGVREGAAFYFRTPDIAFRRRLPNTLSASKSSVGFSGISRILYS
jgi:hypothetical protein